MASGELQGEVDVTMGVFMVDVPKAPTGPVHRPLRTVAPVGVGALAVGAYLLRPRPMPHVVQER